MDLRYQKQIKLFKNQEIKISKSGLLPNYRTKKGSTTTKDFSIKSEIPCLSYRPRFSISQAGC